MENHAMAHCNKPCRSLSVYLTWSPAGCSIIDLETTGGIGEAGDLRYAQSLSLRGGHRLV